MNKYALLLTIVAFLMLLYFLNTYRNNANIENFEDKETAGDIDKKTATVKSGDIFVNRRKFSSYDDDKKYVKNTSWWGNKNIAKNTANADPAPASDNHFYIYGWKNNFWQAYKSTGPGGSIHFGGIEATIPESTKKKGYSPFIIIEQSETTPTTTLDPNSKANYRILINAAHKKALNSTLANCIKGIENNFRFAEIFNKARSAYFEQETSGELGYVLSISRDPKTYSKKQLNVALEVIENTPNCKKLINTYGNGDYDELIKEIVQAEDDDGLVDIETEAESEEKELSVKTTKAPTLIFLYDAPINKRTHRDSHAIYKAGKTYYTYSNHSLNQVMNYNKIMYGSKYLLSSEHAIKDSKRWLSNTYGTTKLKDGGFGLGSVDYLSINLDKSSYKLIGIYLDVKTQVKEIGVYVSNVPIKKQADLQNSSDFTMIKLNGGKENGRYDIKSSGGKYTLFFDKFYKNSYVHLVIYSSHNLNRRPDINGWGVMMSSTPPQIESTFGDFTSITYYKGIGTYKLSKNNSWYISRPLEQFPTAPSWITQPVTTTSKPTTTLLPDGTTTSSVPGDKTTLAPSTTTTLAPTTTISADGTTTTLAPTTTSSVPGTTTTTSSVPGTTTTLAPTTTISADGSITTLAPTTTINPDGSVTTTLAPTTTTSATGVVSTLSPTTTSSIGGTTTTSAPTVLSTDGTTTTKAPTQLLKSDITAHKIHSNNELQSLLNNAKKTTGNNLSTEQIMNKIEEKNKGFMDTIGNYMGGVINRISDLEKKHKQSHLVSRHHDKLAHDNVQENKVTKQVNNQTSKHTALQIDLLRKHLAKENTHKHEGLNRTQKFYASANVQNDKLVKSPSNNFQYKPEIEFDHKQPSKKIASAYGWSYMPPQYWSVPQKRPPVCIPAKGKASSVLPIYDKGTPVDALDWTQVGSMLPKFEYNEVYNPNYYYPGWVAQDKKTYPFKNAKSSEYYNLNKAKPTN